MESGWFSYQRKIWPWIHYHRWNNYDFRRKYLGKVSLTLLSNRLWYKTALLLVIWTITYDFKASRDGTLELWRWKLHQDNATNPQKWGIPLRIRSFLSRYWILSMISSAFLRFRCRIVKFLAILPSLATKSAKNLKLCYYIVLYRAPRARDIIAALSTAKISRPCGPRYKDNGAT